MDSRQALAAPAIAGPLLLMLLVSASSPALGAEGYRCGPLKEPPSKEVAEPIRNLLAPQGLRVADSEGEPFVDVWLRKSVKTRKGENELGIYFGRVAEGTLLGVMRFHKRGKDFRGHRFPAGTYVFRLGILPEDGDHQGVSESRDYVLLCPVKLDVKPDPVAGKKLNKLSAKATGTKHPSTLFLMKMYDKAEKLPRLVEDQDYEYWILDCQVPDAEKGEKPVRMGIVLVGESEEA